MKSDNLRQAEEAVAEANRLVSWEGLLPPPMGAGPFNPVLRQQDKARLADPQVLCKSFWIKLSNLEPEHGPHGGSLPPRAKHRGSIRACT